MREMFLKRLLLSRWRLHIPCALLCLLACIPLLWPEQPQAGANDPVAGYAGMLIAGTFLISATMMVLMVFHLLLRLRNKKASLYLLAWLGQWSVAFSIFVLMAIAADVPPLTVEETVQPIQQTDTLHPAKDELMGPAALVIPILPENSATDVVEATPNLTKLEQEHEALFSNFLTNSPRWAPQADDTFYSRPGHVVMVPPATGGTPGLVHVCFRHLVEGDPLPQGYTVVKSGDAFPKAAAGNEQIPDLALELGGKHYLLLAWRGTSHQETAHKALNAAIAAVDSRMQELADSPTAETAAAMNRGKVNLTGHTPELRLCEPPAQYGAYQAEIYANPQEPGTLLVYIRDLETNRTLRILNCPAQHSENSNELFRHDLPGSVPLWIRDGGFSSSRKLFEPQTPLFAIREGEPHHYFGVAFEVRFKPIDPRQPSRLILRRCYKVEAYEKPAPSEPSSSVTKRTPDELTPAIALPAPQPIIPATPLSTTKENHEASPPEDAEDETVPAAPEGAPADEPQQTQCKETQPSPEALPEDEVTLEPAQPAETRQPEEEPPPDPESLPAVEEKQLNAEETVSEPVPQSQSEVPDSEEPAPDSVLMEAEENQGLEPPTPPHQAEEAPQPPAAAGGAVSAEN